MNILDVNGEILEGKKMIKAFLWRGVEEALWWEYVIIKRYL